MDFNKKLTTLVEKHIAIFDFDLAQFYAQINFDLTPSTISLELLARTLLIDKMYFQVLLLIQSEFDTERRSLVTEKKGREIISAEKKLIYYFGLSSLKLKINEDNNFFDFKGWHEDDKKNLKC